jgi:hypothetical protein
MNIKAVLRVYQGASCRRGVGLNLTAFCHNRCTLSTLGSSYSLSNFCCSSFSTFPLYTFQKKKKREGYMPECQYHT